MCAEPGAAFIYGPSHLQIFSELLRRKLRGRDVISYFEGRVSNRLGLGRLNYKKTLAAIRCRRRDLSSLPANGRDWASSFSGKVVITGDKLFRQLFCERHLLVRRQTRRTASHFG